MRLTAPPGNTGVVPPWILDRMGAGDGAKTPGAAVPGSAGNGSDCFPQVPTKKDPSGVDVIFTDVKLPKEKAAPVNLMGSFAPDCFPHVPTKADPSGLQIIVTGVVLPN